MDGHRRLERLTSRPSAAAPRPLQATPLDHFDPSGVTRSTAPCRTVRTRLRESRRMGWAWTISAATRAPCLPAQGDGVGRPGGRPKSVVLATPRAQPRHEIAHQTASTPPGRCCRTWWEFDTPDYVDSQDMSTSPLCDVVDTRTSRMILGSCPSTTGVARCIPTRNCRSTFSTAWKAPATGARISATAETQGYQKCPSETDEPDGGRESPSDLDGRCKGRTPSSAEQTGRPYVMLLAACMATTFRHHGGTRERSHRQRPHSAHRRD